ncbi:MAG TPA: hypothetical protein EYG75_06630 [Campylobacterales bacterium]|nr:hypothetical protein [Campylobacterales bacterium]
MLFEYKDERVEYSAEELHKLEDGEMVNIDFNGSYMIEFRKETRLGAFISTGKGIDGYGRPIQVARTRVPIEHEEIK